MSVYTGQTPKRLYRSFFRYLRHIPDPHVWSILQPRVRNLLDRSIRVHGHDDGDLPESSLRAQQRAVRARKRAEDEVRKLHMAVGCHPHALRRLLADCYGRIGSIRWMLLNNVMASHTPPLSPLDWPAIPAVLQPLTPPPVSPLPTAQRARTTIPDTAKRKAAARLWTRQWTGVQVPLIIPMSNTPKTGWEGKGIVESLSLLAQLDRPLQIPTDPVSTVPCLPTFRNLPRHVQGIYPTKLKPSHVDQYPPPPPRATRQNPSTWSNPHTLTRRLLRRTYKRLWDRLPWVRPTEEGGERWEKCSYEDLESAGSGPKKGGKSKQDKKRLATKRSVARLGNTVDGEWL